MSKLLIAILFMFVLINNPAFGDEWDDKTSDEVCFVDTESNDDIDDEDAIAFTGKTVKELNVEWELSESSKKRKREFIYQKICDGYKKLSTDKDRVKKCSENVVKGASKLLATLISSKTLGVELITAEYICESTPGKSCTSFIARRLEQLETYCRDEN